MCRINSLDKDTVWSGQFSFSLSWHQSKSHQRQIALWRAQLLPTSSSEPKFMQWQIPFPLPQMAPTEKEAWWRWGTLHCAHQLWWRRSNILKSPCGQIDFYTLEEQMQRRLQLIKPQQWTERRVRQTKNRLLNCVITTAFERNVTNHRARHLKEKKTVLSAFKQTSQYPPTDCNTSSSTHTHTLSQTEHTPRNETEAFFLYGNYRNLLSTNPGDVDEKL